MDIKKYKSQDRILLAVDCIIFGFNGTEMKALLIKRGFEPEKGKWSLMGGFVGEKEPVNDAAARVLKQLTGLTNIYMEQLQCFGDTHRDTAGRVVSVAYFALINIENYNEQLTHDHEARWFAMSKIPPLIFDHKLMLRKAKKILAEKVSNHPIGFELLPIKFTLRQLQNLYEAIFEAPLDKRNFTRKILSINVLKKLKEKERESSRKGAFYYRFDRATYEKLQNDKIEFI
jgi:ADP-ribose pyrophosphatase YjhB (NUDIX family)